MSKEAARDLTREVKDVTDAFNSVIRSLKGVPFDKNAPVVSQYKVELEPGEGGALFAGLQKG
jgi:hypothetical protein